METKLLPLFSAFSLCFVLSFAPVFPFPYGRNYGQGSGQLDYDFYTYSCPGLLSIVGSNVWAAFKKEPRIAASLLRMHFHDCIGCDASILLDDTKDMKGEKKAPPNIKSVRGYELIDSIKADVEKACPRTVSCADILALAAREAVVMSGGPYWGVQLGRRDGVTASEKDVIDQIPSPVEPLDNITLKFTSKGLDKKDVVALSGGHTIGFAQCFTFKYRLFNFKGSGKPDPTLDASLVSKLQTMCSSKDSSNANLAPLDVVSTDKFDNAYYTNLVKKSGLLESDQALMKDPDMAALVNSYSTNPNLFYNDFATSMVKLGNVGVLTRKDGQIRTKCGTVN